MSVYMFAVTDGNGLLNQYKSANDAARYLSSLTVDGKPGRDMGYYVAKHDPDGWKSQWVKMAKQPVYNPHVRKSL